MSTPGSPRKLPRLGSFCSSPPPPVAGMRVVNFSPYVYVIAPLHEEPLPQGERARGGLLFGGNLGLCVVCQKCAFQNSVENVLPARACERLASHRNTTSFQHRQDKGKSTDEDERENLIGQPTHHASKRGAASKRQREVQARFGNGYNVWFSCWFTPTHPRPRKPLHAAG